VVVIDVVPLTCNRDVIGEKQKRRNIFGDIVIIPEKGGGGCNTSAKGVKHGFGGLGGMLPLGKFHYIKRNCAL